METIFSKIIRKEIPADIVYEDAHTLAFRDVSPQAPVHILVIPKIAVVDVTLADAETLALLMAAVKSIVEEQQLKQGGFRIVINTGEDGGQSVSHLHVHILAGRKLGWPPG